MRYLSVLFIRRLLERQSVKLLRQLMLEGSSARSLAVICDSGIFFSQVGRAIAQYFSTPSPSTWLCSLWKVGLGELGSC